MVWNEISELIHLGVRLRIFMVRTKICGVTLMGSLQQNDFYMIRLALIVEGTYIFEVDDMMPSRHCPDVNARTHWHVHVAYPHFGIDLAN